MDIKVIIIVGFSYLYGFFELFMNLRNRNKSRVTSSGDKGSLWLLYGLITTRLFPVLCNRHDQNRQDLSLEYFFRHWSGTGRDRIDHQDHVHYDAQAILYLFSGKGRGS